MLIFHPLAAGCLFIYRYKNYGKISNCFIWYTFSARKTHLTSKDLKQFVISIVYGLWRVYYSTREYGVTFYRHSEYKCLLKTTLDPNWFFVPYLKSLPLPKILWHRYYCKYKLILSIITFSVLYGWYCSLHLL